jgi:hypothetical protein
MKVWLIGFRGLGFTKDFKNEDALIRAGHVGWQLEGDKRIFGFHPTKEAVDKVGGDDAAIEWLKEHKTLDGAVQVDNAIFERANELVPILEAKGAKRIPRVWQQTIELSDEEFQRIKEIVELWYTQNKTAAYGFPSPTSGTEVNNCATFPRVLGLPLPEETGQLSAYIPKLEALGEPWQGVSE